MRVSINHIGWKRVLIIQLPYIIFVGIFQFIGSLIANVDLTNIESFRTPQQDFILSLSTLIGTVLIIWYFTKNEKESKSFTDGFRIKNRLSDIIMGLSIGILIISLGYLILILINEITFENIRFDLSKLLFTILTFISVAIVEEIFLRGYVLRNLMISFNKYVALLLSSVLFAIIHGFNPNIDLFSLTNIFIAGFLLGITYIYTKNLWFPIALHFSWNLMQAILGFNVSGNRTFSIVEFSIKENNRLNGGDFGFEGSILSMGFQIFFIIIIVLYYKRKTKYNNAQNHAECYDIIK